MTWRVTKHISGKQHGVTSKCRAHSSSKYQHSTICYSTSVYSTSHARSKALSSLPTAHAADSG